MHAPNLTSNRYSDLKDVIDEHYKQMRNRANPIEQIDFSTRKNPNYWLKKFGNHKQYIAAGNIYKFGD